MKPWWRHGIRAAPFGINKALHNSALVGKGDLQAATQIATPATIPVPNPTTRLSACLIDCRVASRDWRQDVDDEKIGGGLCAAARMHMDPDK